jgi:hypothetical protein
VFANTLVLVETSFKVATGPFASGDPQVTLSHVECLSQALALDTARPLVALGSRSTRVALRGSREVSTIPLTTTSPDHRTIFSRASTETTTKLSRRWLLVFINTNRKDSQAHGYRCSFHPEGFKYRIHRETCELTTCSNLTRKGE